MYREKIVEVENDPEIIDKYVEVTKIEYIDKIIEKPIYRNKIVEVEV